MTSLTCLAATRAGVGAGAWMGAREVTSLMCLAGAVVEWEEEEKEEVGKDQTQHRPRSLTRHTLSFS